MNHLITLATTRKNSLKILLWIIFISLTRNGITQDKISRKQLLVAHLAQQPVKKVDVQEINFEPGQKAGAHKHLCPVAGYIVSGTVLFETNGDSLKILKAGDAFFEPAGIIINRFDNASDKAPLKFIACYLVGDEKQLIQMLNDKNKYR